MRLCERWRAVQSTGRPGQGQLRAAHPPDQRHSRHGENRIGQDDLPIAGDRSHGADRTDGQGERRLRGAARREAADCFAPAGCESARGQRPSGAGPDQPGLERVQVFSGTKQRGYRRQRNWRAVSHRYHRSRSGHFEHLPRADIPKIFAGRFLRHAAKGWHRFGAVHFQGDRRGLGRRDRLRDGSRQGQYVLLLPPAMARDDRGACGACATAGMRERHRYGQAPAGHGRPSRL